MRDSRGAVDISGQLSQVGAQTLANKIAGNVPPSIGTATPTWKPGLDWVRTGLAPAAAPGTSTATSGGTVAAGTYQVVVTYVTASGESLPSPSSSQVTTGATSTLTVTSPAATTGATGWYAYVTQAGGSTYTRQQAAGSPTAIGTNLTLTAPPTSTGANPPTMDTSLVPSLYSWNGSAWISGASPRYIALLTASPFTSGPGGGPAQAITDLVELTTTGYSRQAYPCSDATAAYPAVVANSGTLTFGPMTANMTLSAQWAALVTASSGTAGLLLYFWTLDTPQQVSISQSIQIPVGDLSLSES